MDDQKQDHPPADSHADAPAFPVVGIGASAGGFAALATLLQNMPASPGMAQPPAIEVFASDIDAHAIATARAGPYPASIADDVAPDRLQRHFTLEGGDYKVRKALRDMVLFAAHNVLHDAAFSGLDLVSCRNFLIYLNREMHRRVLATFHFALRPGGWMMLGSAETADDAASLFAPVDATQRIYQARASGRAKRRWRCRCAKRGRPCRPKTGKRRLPRAGAGCFPSPRSTCTRRRSRRRPASW